MGFVRLKCEFCNNAGMQKRNPKLACTNCNGDSTILTHTGVIGSHLIVEHPSPKADQADWATLWEKINDIPELRESGPIEDQTSRSQ